MELPEAIQATNALLKQFAGLQALHEILVLAEKSERWAKEANTRLEKRNEELAAVNRMIAEKRDELATIERQNGERKASLKAQYEADRARYEADLAEMKARHKAEDKAADEAHKKKLTAMNERVRQREKELINAEGVIEQKKALLDADLEKRKAFQKEQLELLDREVKAEEERLKSVRKDFETLRKQLNG